MSRTFGPFPVADTYTATAAPAMPSDLVKAVGEAQAIIAEAGEIQRQAKLLGALVNTPRDRDGLYRSSGGGAEKGGVSPGLLQETLAHCAPAYCCVDFKRKAMAAFSQIPAMHRGLARSPGFRIRMTDLTAQPSARDKANMAELERVIMNCGECVPPPEERPLTWEPSFTVFTSLLADDSLVLDQAAVMRWPDKSVPGRRPCVAWWPTDGGRVQRVPRVATGLKAGVPIYEEFAGERVTNSDRIDFIMMSDSERGGIKEGEYTWVEMAFGVRNSSTRKNRRGYGFSEHEASIEYCTDWIKARLYNALRMDKDTLPRGIMTVLAQCNVQQLERLRLQMEQSNQGLQKRWTIPMFVGQPGQGSIIDYKVIDPSSRDMEFNQWFYHTALNVHAAHGLVMAQTGFDSANPFRPPLSQASPDEKIKMSQDRSTGSLLYWYASFLTREIVWPYCGHKRYTLEFVGLGDVDYAAECKLWADRLRDGIATPRMAWAEQDLEIPAELADSPAWDLPCPIMQGLAYLDNQAQVELQNQQSQRQHAMQEDQQRRGADMQSAQRMVQQGYGQEDGLDEDQQGGGGMPGRGDPSQNGHKPALGEMRKALLDSLPVEAWCLV